MSTTQHIKILLCNVFVLQLLYEARLRFNTDLDLEIRSSV